MSFGDSYQAWLEAPYQDAARRQDEFEQWADGHEPDLDWDDDDAVAAAWDRYEGWLTEQEQGGDPDLAYDAWREDNRG